MATEQPRRPWEQQVRDAAAHLEVDLKKIATYINDEVVPDVRRNSAEALKAASEELHRLAQRLDDHARKRSASSSPPPPPGTPAP